MSFSLDDFDINDDSYISKKDLKTVGSIYDLVGLGSSIGYDIQNKMMIPIASHPAPNILYMGVSLENDKDKRLINVLYKGFLSKDPIEISATIKTYNMQAFIKKTFDHYKESIVAQMPRIKRLKRLNLKMLSKYQVNILYNKFDDIINGYQDAFGYEYAQELKAQIVTTPFYILDNGVIKIYHFDTNELTIPEYEPANFFCYFTYHY